MENPAPAVPMYVCKCTLYLRISNETNLTESSLRKPSSLIYVDLHTSVFITKRVKMIMNAVNTQREREREKKKGGEAHLNNFLPHGLRVAIYQRAPC